MVDPIAERPGTSILHKPTSVVRVLAGFLIAPLPIGILGLAVFGPGVAMIMQAYASGLAVALGLPTYLLFRWMGWTGPVPTIVGGASLGFAASLYLVPHNYPSVNNLVFIIYGAVVSGLFWLIARPRRLA